MALHPSIVLSVLKGRQKNIPMKGSILFVLFFCLTASFAFAQTEEEVVKEDVKTEMEQLKKDMEALRLELRSTMENLKTGLQDLDIDLSGLDQLGEIEWEKHVDDEEALAYLNSEKFREEMKKVQEEVDKAMEEVRVEMANIEKANWDEINKAIEEAMKEVERELSNMGKEE